MKRGRLDGVRARLVAPKRAALGTLSGRLDALSPVAILARGYAIVIHEKTGRALVAARDARPATR